MDDERAPIRPNIKPDTKQGRSKYQICSKNPLNRIQPLPAVHKVQSWLLNSFKGASNIENYHQPPAALEEAINCANPLRSLPPDVGEADVASENKDNDDSSVDTTSYIKLNRTVTRLQKRDVSIRKYSKPGTLIKSHSPEPTFVKTDQRSIPDRGNNRAKASPAAKRKRLVKCSSSMNLRLKRSKRCDVGQLSSSSSSSEEPLDGIAALRSTTKKILLAKKRVRHDSV